MDALQSYKNNAPAFEEGALVPRIASAKPILCFQRLSPGVDCARWHQSSVSCTVNARSWPKNHG